MNVNFLRNKAKSFLENKCIPELIMTVFLGLLMLIQRFLTGGYKPVMDDWFLYGDLYTNAADRMTQFAIPNEKFAIRPFAGIFDCFVNAPLFRHIWIAQLFVTLSLLFGAFLIIKALRRNNTAGAGFFMCIVCLFPVGFEATYWLAAATRISYSMLFIGAAVFALDNYYKTNRRRSLILYSLLGLVSVGFYEPAIVIYIILTLFIIWNNKDKKPLLPIIILAVQICIIGIYYLVNSGAGEIESRGGIVDNNLMEHTSLVAEYIKDIFTSKSLELMQNGLSKGFSIVLGGHKFMKLAIISGLSLGFGVFSAICIKKRRFSLKILILGIALFFGGIILNFVLGSERIPLRLVYFSYLGAGIIIDEILMLLPCALNKILCAVLITFFAFRFTVAGIGEVSDYQQVSDFDVYITQQLIDLDTPERITDVDKNTYLFGGQHSYEETRCIHYFDHIRGASGNYADITGCMRHLANVPFTNNIVTFTYGDTAVMKPYIDQEGVCRFYNVEYDKTVVPVSLVSDGENYNVVREDGSLVGTLVKADDKRYQFFN